MTSRRRRLRAAAAVVAGLPLAVSAALPPSAPGLLFWTCVGLSCAGGAAWGWLSQDA